MAEKKWKVKLANTSCRPRFEWTLSTYQIKFKECNYAKGLTIYKVWGIDDGLAALIGKMEGVISIEEMPTIVLDGGRL